MRIVRHLLRLYLRWRDRLILIAALIVFPALAVIESSVRARGLCLFLMLIGVLLVILDALDTIRRLRRQLAIADPWRS
jgi:hypothetical protein